MSEKDLVEEARDFVVTSALRTNPDRARGFIEALCDEVERLRDFAREFAFEEGDDFEGRVQALRTFHGKD